MHYPDMTPYTYYSQRPFPNVRNVGWLDLHNKYVKGPIGAAVLDKLSDAMVGNANVNIHVNKIRGIHPCNLCDLDHFDNPKLEIGSTEIWLPDGSGGYLASPSMLIHYMTVHEYYPPRQFIAAINRFDLFEEFQAQAHYNRLASIMMTI